ncbi:MAG TPA: T9SS type A sorting domain-containing protein [Prolixibacteraceae bacterium]|nr:T9SS type A sorting domain-containing protein [Prolixibacteraceae bacterium]
MLRKMFVFLICLFSVTFLFAQEGTSAAGGDIRGTSGTLSYSVGQVFYSETSTSGIALSEGVQQAFEIYRTSVDESFRYPSFRCSVYPNPTLRFLSLEMDLEPVSGFSYELLDTNGKRLKTETINEKNTSIDMASYSPAVYFLLIRQGSENLATYKIIKN